MLHELLMPLFLMVMGLFLLFVEIVIIPGFGLIGLAGFGLEVAGVIMVWNIAGAFWGSLSVALAVPIFAGSLWLFFKSKASKQLSLQDKIEGDSSRVPELQHLLGKTGVAVSTLRPSGIAMIEKTRYDVVTDGEFIEKGEPIVVVQIETNSIVVDKPIAED